MRNETNSILFLRVANNPQAIATSAPASRRWRATWPPSSRCSRRRTGRPSR
jgi:hypothetical protein